MFLLLRLRPGLPDFAVGGGVDDFDGAPRGGGEQGAQVGNGLGTGTTHIALGVDAAYELQPRFRLYGIFLACGKFRLPHKRVVPGVNHLVGSRLGRLHGRYDFGRQGNDQGVATLLYVEAVEIERD